MLSTIFGAIEFLEGQHFSQLLKDKKNKQKQPHPKYEAEQVGFAEAKGQSETKGGTSLLGEGSSAREEGSQPDRHEMQFSSML